MAIQVASIAGAMFLAAAPVAGASLGAYNVDPFSVSVSGLSSGGFFSAQLGVAYSDVFPVGFGVFAGGPFDCARNQAVSLPHVESQTVHLYPGLTVLLSSTIFACTTIGPQSPHPLPI